MTEYQLNEIVNNLGDEEIYLVPGLLVVENKLVLNIETNEFESKDEKIREMLIKMGIKEKETK